MDKTYRPKFNTEIVKQLQDSNRDVFLHPAPYDGKKNLYTIDDYGFENGGRSVSYETTAHEIPYSLDHFSLTSSFKTRSTRSNLRTFERLILRRLLYPCFLEFLTLVVHWIVIPNGNSLGTRTSRPLSPYVPLLFCR